MKRIIALSCIAIALFLDSLSYYRQIKKTLRTKRSSQVSSTSFIYKMLKAKFSMVGLALYSNWIGFGMEVFMFAVYAISLGIIIKFKPKSWNLWGTK